MTSISKRSIATVAAVACLGGAGWALAADNGSSSSGASTGTAATTQVAASTTSTTTPTAPAQGQRGPGGQHPGEVLMTGDAAAKAKAAALAKVPGATIVRVETNSDGGGPNEAHITKSDGSPATVLMDANFNVLSVLDR